MKKWWIGSGFLLILLIPSLWWYAQPSTELHTLIFNKTVAEETYSEHKGLMWLMNHEKYVDHSGDSYDFSEDYAGYHPGTEENTSLPEDLSSYSFFYLADTYGVDGSPDQGLSSGEAERLETALSEEPRPFVAEYNSFSSPTEEEARSKMSSLLEIQTSGWRGKYFSSLEKGADTAVPEWAIENYENRQKDDWSFTGAGFLFAHDDGSVIILDGDMMSENTGVSLSFTEAGTSLFDLTESPPYSGWFDIIESSYEENVLASFDLKLKEEGSEKLKEAGIPSSFPAVTRTEKEGAPFYYFAGNFAEMTDVPGLTGMKGLPALMKWTPFGGNEDSLFYWKTYAPMMDRVLKEAASFSSDMTSGKEQTAKESPSRVQAGEFEIYKDGEWTTELIKGVNMGMANPGSFPGEAAITEQEYARWFEHISEMNANALRVYTRHPPEFYKALKRHNDKVDSPLYVFHGVWAEEEPLVEHLDSFNEESTTKFKEEIRELIDVVHGNADIEKEPGHASGSYTSDISDYIAGWIIGVEWYPQMVQGTNEAHEGIGEFEGDYLFTEGASPFEHWLTSMMDFTVTYEKDTYGAERPISFTNWVTTDLLDHPSEPLPQEDMASVDPNVIKAKDSFTRGMFASYHVYPYYPDFLNYDDEYLAYTDHRGEKNSYAGYLNDLISRHDMPVLIAEFGVPGSRGKTHENPFGLDQGHHSEKEQGEINRRLFEDIVAEGAMGGLVFTWQDEWFKRTWNTMELDNPDRRPFWSNAETNEQQFGLLAFDRLKRTIDGRGGAWGDQELARKDSDILRSFAADHDERYLYIRMETSPDFSFEGEILSIGIDTINNQGIKSVSGTTFDHGLDFLLDISGKDDAQLTVDSYYDPFHYQYGHLLGAIDSQPYAKEKDNGIFHPIRLALNKELVLPDTGEVVPFTSYETGSLKHGNADPASEQYDSLTDYSIGSGVVEIRIPWLLLNIKDPSQKEQMTDLWNGGLEGSGSFEEIRFTAFIREEGGAVTDILPGESSPADFMSYSWENWDIPEYEERLKRSYDIMKQTFSEH